MSTLRRPDPRTVALAGLTTWAWYAVPDVVGPRWARATAKSVIGVGATALAVGGTREGRELRAGLRDLADAVAADVEALPGDPAGPDLGPDDLPCEACDPTPAGRDAPDEDPADDNPAPTAGAVVAAGAPTAGAVAAVGVGTLAAVGLAVAAAVAGERWAYRRGEALRERGVVAPHTRVGFVLGLLAAGLAAIDLDLDGRPADDRDPTGDPAPAP
ncbi:hypothetical protein ATJ88_0471 [Isoptericola jiangsuensis]|uniref:Peptidase S9 n=1 Tax=Isoptericola jiangsuensis TaxID=548579 RepID=A0A2A9ESH5_9MICO|nr:hypothetical protein [Isoptericola jiangsuensis]PFG41828.1 hypothetical protein ATJ88_0471 [Isoptericola jiangsuensis]